MKLHIQQQHGIKYNKHSLHNLVKFASEGWVVITLCYVKQKKYESMEDYYNQFLQRCVIIPQQLDDMYLHEAFREGLWTKVQMVIISMSQRKLVDIIEFVITVEGELLGRWKNIAKYHQANLDSERLDYSDKENHCKTKKKYTKI